MKGLRTTIKLQFRCKKQTAKLEQKLFGPTWTSLTLILSCHPFYKVKSWITSHAKTVLQNGASHILIKPTHSRGQQLSEFLIDTVIVILIIFIIIFTSIKKGNSFRVVLGLVGKKHRSQVQVDALFINLL